MSIYGKGWKGKATKLHSQIVRSLGYCQRCGERDSALLQCAHIASRKYSATRTDISASLCLCAKCHRYFHDVPTTFRPFVISIIGEEKLADIEAKAQPITKMDWEAEYHRLKEFSENL